MTSTVSSTEFSSLSIHDENLEIFSLVWLDASLVDGQKNSHFQQQLRSIINQLKLFSDLNECEKYIQAMPKDDRLVLIINENFAQELIPRIHQLPQIWAIYIHCPNKTENQQWTNNFHKIKSTNDDLHELISQIKADQIWQRRIGKPFSVNIFDPGHTIDRSSNVNNDFIQMQILIDCFLRLKSIDDNNRNELIDLCKNEYSNNLIQLKILNEFEHNYSSSNALWWYTIDSFLYRLLTKALYKLNFNLLYNFRFFIQDIYRQLIQYQCLTFVQVYRNQLMSNEELELFKNSIGKFISINSFLSTSIDRIPFPKNQWTEDDIQPILFIIEADPRSVKTKPFANITVHSHMTSGEEILFSLGSIFRLEDIQQEKNGIWIIKMILTSESDHHLKSTFDHIKKTIGEGEMSLLSFGTVLRRMGKLDEAERCYRRLLTELPADHEYIHHCYHNLGRIADAKGDYQASLLWMQQALDIKLRTMKSTDPSLAHSYNCIGILYQEKGDQEKALESFQRALIIWKGAFGKDHPKVAGCFNNMGVAYKREKKYTKALECFKKALISREKHLSADHPDLAGSHNNIGAVYVRLGHYDLALEHYNMSLKIKSKSFPPQHTSIASTLENMGYVYEKREAFLQALSYFEKAATIYRHTLPTTHPDVIQIEASINRVSSKI